MLTTLAGLVVATSPFLAVVGLLWLAARRDRAREAAVARQIRLTDAIAAELGAIVAPVVKKRRWGRWQIEMAVPLARPATVGAVLSIAHRVLPGGYEFVLTPQESGTRRDTSAGAAEPRLRAA